jgi:hypothetical protein
MQPIFWRISQGVERAVAWFVDTTLGGIVGIALVVLICILAALIASRPAFGLWAIVIVAILVGLRVVLRRR